LEPLLRSSWPLRRRDCLLERFFGWSIVALLHSPAGPRWNANGHHTRFDAVDYDRPCSNHASLADFDFGCDRGSRTDKAMRIDLHRSGYRHTETERDILAND